MAFRNPGNWPVASSLGSNPPALQAGGRDDLVDSTSRTGFDARGIFNMMLRGVDGCPAGWLAVSLDLATGKVTGQVFPEDAVSLLRDPDVAVTAIVIPIGLPSRERTRTVDGVARKRLGPRASSVFPSPPRATLP